MTWREELRPASFRDVPFFVEQVTQRQGLQADEQVFPARSYAGDAVHVEHLGMGPRRFAVEAFVVGDDYRDRRDALEAVLLQPGSGRLVHPYRGELVVSVIGDVSTTESRKRGGYARISFTVVVTDSPRLARTVDTAAVIERDLDAFLDALAADFEEQYDTEGVPAAFQESSQSVFEDAVDLLEDVYAAALSGIGEAGDFANDVEAGVTDLGNFVSAPFDAAEDLIAALAQITSAPERILQSALGTEAQAGALVDSLFSAAAPLIRFGEDLEEIAETTPHRATEARLRNSVVQLVRGAAIGQTARALATLPFASAAQARDVRDELVEEIDRLIEESSASGDTVSGADLYEAIAAARTAIVAHLSALARTLPEIETYVMPASIPALVLAHQLYGDARRAEEIVARNDPSTPGWLPVGLELEVLRG